MTAIITDHLATGHNLPTKWLRARVAGWMWSICEGFDWWVCAITRTGEFAYASSDGELVDIPCNDQTEYARKVVRYLNQHCCHGGAWLAGWIGKRQFVLVWKDADGDIKINNTCDVPWEQIRDWDMEDWAEQAEQALAVHHEMHRKMGWSQSEQINLAQGEKPRQRH